MESKKNAELKREAIIAKFIRKLKMFEKDPGVLDYNFYSDKSFVGVKIMRNKKITLDELAAIVIEGFAEQKKFNERIESKVDLMMSTPTMKKELEELKKK